MYWVAVKSVLAAVKGRRVGWGKLERRATVDMDKGEGGQKPASPVRAKAKAAA